MKTLLTDHSLTDLHFFNTSILQRRFSSALSNRQNNCDILKSMLRNKEPSSLKEKSRENNSIILLISTEVVSRRHSIHTPHLQSRLTSKSKSTFNPKYLYFFFRSQRPLTRMSYPLRDNAPQEYVPSERYWQRMESSDENMGGPEAGKYDNNYTRYVNEDKRSYPELFSRAGPSMPASYTATYPPIIPLPGRPVSMRPSTSGQHVIERSQEFMEGPVPADTLACLQSKEPFSFSDSEIEDSEIEDDSPDLWKTSLQPGEDICRTEIKETDKLNRTMLTQMPPGTNLISSFWGLFTEGDLYPEGRPFYSMYDPLAGKDTVSKLWWGVFRNSTHVYTAAKKTAAAAACARFDHVDLYRIIYITTVFQKTAYDVDEAFLTILAEILTRAGRPHGYGRILLHRRAPPGASKPVYTTAELRDLFDVLGNKLCIGRDKAFMRVLKWVTKKPNSPPRVLAGLPEVILGMGSALSWYELKWECRPFSFMYENGPPIWGGPIVNGSPLRSWYREDHWHPTAM
jgi:hypothetical protein